MSENDSETSSPPLSHLAIIMDGNGRWAKQRGLPRLTGHQHGVEAVTRIVDECVRRKISYLSLFAFSSENWGRPQPEVDALMALLLQFLASQRKKMVAEGVRLKVVGDLTRLSASVQSALLEAEEKTAIGQNLTLILALSYGGRDEIMRAAKKLTKRVVAGEIDVDTIDNATLANCLDTCEFPDPDLLIRTSGEVRISNFLLWQTAYSELYFTDVLWPDFGAVELDKALDEYQCRRRRFGLTDDQLEKQKNMDKYF